MLTDTCTYLKFGFKEYNERNVLQASVLVACSFHE